MFRYNYINVITPFKHHFAKRGLKNEVEKVNGKHVYGRDVEFSEYYNLYNNERSSYPKIAANVIIFESQFNAIMSYRILTTNKICDKNDLIHFLESVRVNAPQNAKYNQKRLYHINKQIDSLIISSEKYHDVYCFFDRLSLGEQLTIFCGLDTDTQKSILQDCEKHNLNLGVKNINAFIKKFFTLVSIRNCVMHSNSLEILIRFYNHRTKDLRKSSDKKKYMSMINEFKKEKPYL